MGSPLNIVATIAVKTVREIASLMILSCISEKAIPAAVAGALLFSILPKIERFAGLREEVEG